MANISPTAANIIASLGIKGVTDGTDRAELQRGYLPMLGADGKLSPEFIPASAAEMSVPPLSDVKFVDSGVAVAADHRNGSIAAPFKTIAEAAGSVNATSRIAIVITPGSYNESSISFPYSDEVYLIGIGKCVLTGSTTAISMRSGAKLFLQEIDAGANGLSVTGASEIACLGETHIGTLTADGITLRMSAESRVDSTSAAKIYLATDSHVGNTSEVHGATVCDALTRLGRRRIRVANISADSSGIDVGSSSYVDIPASSYGSGVEVFDLRGHDMVMVDFLNRLAKNSRDIVAETVTAKTITADEFKTRKLEMDYMAIGGYLLTVDAYGYLVVATDGSESSSYPPVPGPSPDDIIIRDSVLDDVFYRLGVERGRMYIANAEQDGSSPYPVRTELTITDSYTGLEYQVRMENRRMVIAGFGSSSSPENMPTAYAVDETTRRYHRIVAIKDPDMDEEVLGVYQEGVQKGIDINPAE